MFVDDIIYLEVWYDCEDLNAFVRNPDRLLVVAETTEWQNDRETQGLAQHCLPTLGRSSASQSTYSVAAKPFNSTQGYLCAQHQAKALQLQGERYMGTR